METKRNCYWYGQGGHPTAGYSYPVEYGARCFQPEIDNFFRTDSSGKLHPDCGTCEHFTPQGGKEGKTMSENTLQPIDTNRCEAEWRGGSFMTLGPRTMVRCENKPTWIGIAVREGQFYGAMSLCDECREVCQIKEPDVRYQRLKE